MGFGLPPAWARALALASRHRLETFNWLVKVLAQNTGRDWHFAYLAMDAAIPAGHEAMLDNSLAFLPALRGAADALGLDPESGMTLHPIAVH